ncbi:MAG: sulfatase, partial [Myxococcota bacterium]
PTQRPTRRGDRIPMIPTTSPAPHGPHERRALTLRRRAATAVVIAAAAILLLSSGPGGQSGQAVAAQTGGEVWRDLLVETARAELDIGGTLIDFGTGDQHKYTLGGWTTGWGDPKRDSTDVDYAPVSAIEAKISAMTQRPTREVVIRLRSRAPDQQVEVYWGETSLGRSKVGSSWRIVRFPVSGAAAAAGLHQLRLEFRKARPQVAEVDWMWLRSGKSAKPPGLVPRVGPLRLGGGLRRALLAPSARQLSFYLHVPERSMRPALVFEHGSDQAVRFTVRAQTMDGATRELFRATGMPGAWTRARVDLSPFAGRAVRLELATSGPLGRSGWASPEIRVSGQAGGKAGARRSLGASAGKRAKNVVLVVYDTTRADVFRPFAKSTRVVAPNFDALAARSTAFTRAYNNESWTRPSTVTILTGLYPDTHGAIYARSVLTDEVEMLSEHLARHDFQALAIVGNPVLRAKFGMDQGWDEYRNHGRDDDTAARLFGEATEWLADNHNKGRFFLYVHSHDSHTPYEVDRSYSQRYHPGTYRGFVGDAFTHDNLLAINRGKRRVDKDDLAWIRALYDGEATYQDQHFGQLIAKLEELKILDETVIVVTNDHGEEFLEHGQMGHGWTLFEEQLLAPLIIHYPPLFPAGATVADVVEHVDVAPTIVDTLGLPPLADAEGLSLIPFVTGRALPPRPYYAVAELRNEWRAIRVGRWKLIVDRDKGWRGLYDLARDPGEQSDLAQTRPLAGRLCTIYLAEALANPAKARRLGPATSRRRFKSRSVNLDPQTRKELEALGYIGDDAFRDE